MTPQLFINYKMKSVAHLPWRMLTYKALNTFIDDLFAFVIKMPMMYRIGCLRDGMSFLAKILVCSMNLSESGENLPPSKTGGSKSCFFTSSAHMKWSHFEFVAWWRLAQICCVFLEVVSDSTHCSARWQLMWAGS